MTNPQSDAELSEILDRFAPAIQDGDKWIAEAKAAINKLFIPRSEVEAAIPEKKPTSSSLKDKFIDAVTLRNTWQDGYIDGWNEAVDQMEGKLLGGDV